MTRDRWTGLLALVVMFGLGLACGLWLAAFRTAAGVETPPESAAAAPEHDWRRTGPDGAGIPDPENAASARAHHEAALKHLQDAVGLDEEQMEQVHAVFGRHQGVVQDAWQAVQPQIEMAMETVHREVAELLRPEQIARYHEWLLDRRAGHDPHSDTPAEADPQP